MGNDNCAHQRSSRHGSGARGLWRCRSREGEPQERGERPRPCGRRLGKQSLCCLHTAGAPSRCSPTFIYPGFPQKDLSGVAVLSTCKKSDGFLSNAAIQPLVLPKQLSRNAQGRGVRRWHCHITACVSSRAPSHPDEQTSLRAWPLSQGLPLPEK